MTRFVAWRVVLADQVDWVRVICEIARQGGPRAPNLCARLPNQLCILMNKRDLYLAIRIFDIVIEQSIDIPGSYDFVDTSNEDIVG